MDLRMPGIRLSDIEMAVVVVSPQWAQVVALQPVCHTRSIIHDTTSTIIPKPTRSDILVVPVRRLSAV